jgi:hypothetical protein
MTMHAHPIGRQTAQAEPCDASDAVSCTKGSFQCAMSNMHCMKGMVNSGWDAGPT